MGKLIDVDTVKKRFPIMENDFGMVINERLHKELDKIPTVEAIPQADYEARLKADLEAILVELQLEIEESCICTYEVNKLIQQKINELKAESEGE